MICKNCGADIRNRESYCPSCGMELLIPYSKSLKEKYIAGEYHDRQDNYISRDKRKNRVIEDEYTDKWYDEHEQYEEDVQEGYETGKSGSSGIMVTFLFLIMALLFGLVLGLVIFSGSLQSLTGL
ncbi:MAG TPA: zinc-ribbon domain-containing protein [Methanobacterium sp.]|nr:zinc-ribbon domain-containing protein [Methanobacterium sp.]